MDESVLRKIYLSSDFRHFMNIVKKIISEECVLEGGPDDYFTEDELGEWAEANGYIHVEDIGKKIQEMIKKS